MQVPLLKKEPSAHVIHVEEELQYLQFEPQAEKCNIMIIVKEPIRRVTLFDFLMYLRECMPIRWLHHWFKYEFNTYTFAVHKQ